MRAPRGAFGVRWGTPLDEATRTLNMTCEQSYPFDENRGMHVCRGQTRLFETDAWVEIIMHDDTVAAFVVTFPNTPCEALDARVRHELGVPQDIVPLATSWRRGEMVRLDESAGGCVLTVAGREAGLALQRQRDAGAFGNFAAGLRP